MWCRGIRGATVAAANKREDILSATRELLQKMVDSNQVEKQAVTCMFFTTTPDLNAEFPAVAARQLGWTETALMCGHEMDVPHSLTRCVRIMILFNTEKKAEDIVHVYIKGAEVLRQSPDKGGKRT